jgi:hypothetical protein
LNVSSLTSVVDETTNVELSSCGETNVQDLDGTTGVFLVPNLVKKGATEERQTPRKDTGLPAKFVEPPLQGKLPFSLLSPKYVSPTRLGEWACSVAPS